MELGELKIIKEALKNSTCGCINCRTYRAEALQIIENEIKVKENGHKS